MPKQKPVTQAPARPTKAKVMFDALKRARHAGAAQAALQDAHAALQRAEQALYLVESASVADIRAEVLKLGERLHNLVAAYPERLNVVLDYIGNDTLVALGQDPAAPVDAE